MVRVGRSLAVAAAVLAAVMLLLATGCYTVGPRGERVEWDVPPADHHVSQAEARQLAEPVLRAVTDAIDAEFRTGPWTNPPEVTLDEYEPCGYFVQVNGTIHDDPDQEWSEVSELIMRAAQTNGYPNMRPSAKGGPGNVWADVAENDTMLEIFLEGTSAELTLWVPIAADQCKDE